MATKEKRKFTIKRSCWLRGDGNEESRLLRPRDRKMCCIGQVAKQIGYSPTDLRDVAGFASLPVKHGISKDFWKSVDRLAGSCYEDNDDPSLEDWEREKRLAKTAKRHWFTFEFVD